MFRPSLLISSLVLFHVVSSTSAEKPGSFPSLGAIRWDGWDISCGVGKDSQRVLSPKKYQYRAPFFVAEAHPDVLKLKPLSQEIVDQEISYALLAGIDYWAFDWYPPGSGMEGARQYFLASKNRKTLRWCVILGTGPFSMDRDAPWLVQEFAKPGYQKVLDDRPLVYIFTPLARADVDTLRRLSLASAGKNPYIAMMGWTASQVAHDCELLGADAVTMYAGGSKQRWKDYSERMPVIPNVSTGWDPNPFRDTHVSWYPAENVKEPVSAWSASPSQLIAAVRESVDWVAANGTKCPANTVLIYAWNEHSEGGWICPTYTPEGPDTRRIDALHEFLRTAPKHSPSTP